MIFESKYRNFHLFTCEHVFECVVCKMPAIFIIMGILRSNWKQWRSNKEQLILIDTTDEIRNITDERFNYRANLSTYFMIHACNLIWLQILSANEHIYHGGRLICLLFHVIDTSNVIRYVGKQHIFAIFPQRIALLYTLCERVYCIPLIFHTVLTLQCLVILDLVSYTDRRGRFRNAYEFLNLKALVTCA